MFFTRVGTILAWIGFIIGVTGLGTFAFVMLFPMDAETKQYMVTNYLGKNPVKTGNMYVGFVVLSVVLGVLCEISKKLGQRG